MAQIFEEGNVSAHIPAGSEMPVARCYDKRNADFRIVVTIDLLSFFPVEAGEEPDDELLPDWRFLVEAITACATHGDELWEAWQTLKDDFF